MLRAELLAQTPTSAWIPASVRELLRCQLRQLTPSAWALLVAAALMDEGLTFERFCQVARLEEETGLCALEELVRQGWLCEGTPAAQSAACEEYSFPGEMIRTGVSQEAGAVHRRLAQRRVSAVLQEEAEQEQGEEASLPHPASLAGHGLQKLFGWFGGPGFTRAGVPGSSLAVYHFIISRNHAYLEGYVKSLIVLYYWKRICFSL